MKVAAVIAEYNPLHNGHIHLINNIKRELQNDYTIVIMSGDYVERGEPAAFNKELRAKWAIEAGADLVLLLPLPYATASADLFAYGAVTLLNKLGIVDYLCFGSECGDIVRLKECAKILLENGTIDSDEIKSLMKQGNTFAKARSLLFKDYSDILEGSNNILALEYIMALLKINSSIIPYTLKRTGADYNSLETKFEYASASGIRHMIKSSASKNLPQQLPANSNCIIPDTTISELSHFIPEYVIKDIKESRLISFDAFNSELFYSILLNKENLDSFMDVSYDLGNRILKGLNSFTDIESLLELVKTKNYTYARLSRSLLHILLNIKHNNDYYINGLSKLNHIKALAVNKKSTEILNVIKENSRLNVMSRLLDFYNNFNKFEKEIFDLEIFASDLYSKKVQSETNELKKQIAVIK